MKKTLSALAVSAALAATAGSALAFEEFPAGEPVEMNNMEIAAVYLQPIDMEPRGIDMPASQADIHLEADIHATKGNPNGFGAGEWIPYLSVTYRLENTDSGKVTSGTFMPMVAKDGPHYGSNIKMLGAGNYKLTYNIEPPSRQGFGRHTDEETGVGKWHQPFSVDFEFKYAGLKK